MELRNLHSFAILDCLLLFTVVGGDFNVILNQNLDESGAIRRVKDSVTFLDNTCLEHDFWLIFGVYGTLQLSALHGAKRIQLSKDY